MLGLSVAPLASATDKRITDLSQLISLALALVTVFTASRASALTQRAAERAKTKLRVLRAAGVDLALLATTLALTLAATPLFLDSVRDLAPLHAAGALRSVFSVVWLLLVGLIAWQSSISWRTLKQMRGRPWRQT
jgi:hypothetical protein